MSKAKVLLLVEGEKTEKELFDHLYQLYGKSNIEIVPYKTNIYAFYYRLKKDFSDAHGKIEYDSIDLPLFLNDYHGFEGEKRLNEMDFIDKILVFDFDPQDPQYSSEILIELMNNFSNSTEIGKLYLNYPMVESFQDIESLESENFINSMVNFEVLQRRGQYKQDVKKRTFLESIQDIDTEVGRQLIELHYQKVNFILERDLEDLESKYLYLCERQIDKLGDENLIWIVNTSILHLFDEYGNMGI